MLPRSIRGRLTALVTLLAVLVLVPTGIIEAVVGHEAVAEGIWLEVREQAGMTAASVRVGHMSGVLRPHVDGVQLVQVVDAGHRVVEASGQAVGMPPLSAVRPSASSPERDVVSCPPHLGCLRVAALRVEPAADSPVVYAGRSAASARPLEAFGRFFGLQEGVLAILVAWATWKVTGRTLRPVEAIRAELAAINGTDVGSRVPEPAGQDEIARLARTVNGTLSRIEEAKRGTDRALVRQRQFVADASHELRTPLAGLRAELEEAQLHPGETDLPALLDHALFDVDRLESIVGDLLLLARVDSRGMAERVRVDLSDLVSCEVSGRLDRLPVRVVAEPGVWVSVVRGQVARVVTNLLDNAQRHARRSVEVRLGCDGGMAVLSVIDDGRGIPAADRERIFERFTRLDTARSRDHGGTGLGLAIARDIAVAHDGTLVAGESPAGGACFTLRLPLDQAETE
jgi:signal transduction histidine kinase